MGTLQLYNNDCLKVVDSLDVDSSTTYVITSPPYNMNLRIQNGKFVSRWKSKGNENHFATKYSNYKDDLSLKEYYDFQKEFIEKYLEKCNLMFYNTQIVTGNKISLFKLMGHFAQYIKEVIIWDKIHGQPAMNTGYLNSRFELILVLSKNDGLRRTFNNPCFERGTLSNLWEIKRERNNKIKAGFPMELVQRIITNFIPEYSTIIDPFMGSGTCRVVALDNNCNFVGIEADKDMYEIAKERIEKCKIQ